MIITCPSCQKSYETEDSKVPTKASYTSCQFCGNRFLMQGRSASATSIGTQGQPLQQGTIYPTTRHGGVHTDSSSGSIESSQGATRFEFLRQEAAATPNIASPQAHQTSRARTNTEVLAILSIVLGVLSFFILPFIFGGGAIVIGTIAGAKGTKVGWLGLGIGVIGTIANIIYLMMSFR